MPAMLLLVSSLTAAATDIDTYAKGLADPSGWTEVKTKTEDQLGSVQIRHKSIGEIDCLEGVAEVSGASPQRLLEVAADIPSATSWSSADLEFSEVLDTGQGWQDYVQYLDNPMPIKDRYWVLRGHSETTGTVHSFHWKHISSSSYPALEARMAADYNNAVVTDVNVGSWIFEASGELVKMRYRLCTAAGGSIPQWAGEIAATSTLPTNMSDLVKEARRRQAR